MGQIDSVYFSTRPWRKRVAAGLARLHPGHVAKPFIDGHLVLIRHLLQRGDHGPRMVVNIGADALLNFLATGDYKNVYESPAVGGRPLSPTPERRWVDNMIGLEADAADHYFGAVALGGAGVRLYGEYCMVIKPARIPPATRLFDRDSYELLQQPLARHRGTRLKRIVAALSGEWDRDLVDMLVMKMLPRLPLTHHVLTSGNVSQLVMTDQEFVEVHLKGKIAPTDLEEIRQRPEEAAVEAAIQGRKRVGQTPSLVEMRWIWQRNQVAGALANNGIRGRLATSSGHENW